MSQTGPLGRQIGRFWQTSTVSQRIGLAAFGFICAGLLLLVASFARRPQFALVYAGLDQADAGRVVQRMQELKVPYRLGPGGTVEAPADRVDELRLDLAGKGLPSGGQTGFELFDRARFGLSDFGEKINYQRALEGELARTITHLSAVEQARVHVALPEDRLYENDREEATASVVLELRGGSAPTSAQVRSVVHLVAGAVGGLSAERVTVLDTEGRLLSLPDDSGIPGGLGVASTQLELRRAYEKDVEGAVQSMLSGVLGHGKSVVRASADLSFDRVETESETFEPVGEGTGVLESRQVSKETYQGEKAGSVGGAPGVASNLSLTAAGSRAAAGADQYQHEESADQYRVSRRVERRLQPPGQLKALSVSVFIDEKADLGKVKDLRAAVAAAAGLDTEGPDRVIITRLPFQPVEEGKQGSAAGAARDFYFSVGRDFVAILLLLAFLWFVRGLTRRGTGTQREAPANSAAGSAPTGAAVQIAAASPGTAGSGGTNFDPQQSAAVVRDWLNAEKAGAATGGNGNPEAEGPGL